MIVTIHDLVGQPGGLQKRPPLRREIWTPGQPPVELPLTPAQERKRALILQEVQGEQADESS